MMKIIIQSFLLILFLCLISIRAQSVNFTSSNLPIVVINTFGQEIPNEYKIQARMGVIYNGEGVRNYITDPFSHYDGWIGIELRGSSSLTFPKKSYAVETRDSLGNDRSVSLLGFPSEADWVFYGPYNDKTLIRDVLAYKLARDLGRYASRSKFFELVINGEYKGVYVLLEKIKRDANRVNIKKLNPADTSGDALTGGYIIKIDKLDGENNDGWYSNFRPFPQLSARIFYQYHYPKPSEIVEAQKNYIKAWIYAFESAMFGPYYADSILGYQKYIDVNSFVDYILLNELVKNIDAYRLSTFFYKDRDSRNPKLFAGPVWDFNLAFGNCDYYQAFNSSGWYLEYVSEYSNIPSWENYFIPFWWKKIFNDQNFRTKFRQRWIELRNSVWTNEKINSTIDSLVQLLEESRQRNFQKWPVIGQYVWPNYYVGQTYEEEINYLKNWLTSRLAWMDYQLISDVEKEKSEISINDFKLLQNYPNPFNSNTIISYIIPGNLNSLQKVTLKIYDVLGREITTLIDDYQTAGCYSVNFDIETIKQQSISTSVLICQLFVGNKTQTIKMLYLK
ncbi:MAG: spore coat protein CotH [Ignavibacteria bacterium]|nr:spore coat protein CotH [Ignavibacteria bacterium]